ncbi:NADP-dependent oxidoreductase [Gordonia sp. OPL2]|uniref:NADP-dependent oxidoreductase n=1 Tax=Gordonia sp. OPL2 TaxID=2486274 RepID=UPI0016550B53|nr:NADP-dependent oxidoreductase [Gordonia sp. OPL2]ROZ99054.1 NADP-dependent oxidoreductase [Gordonia sp. OPL2]
MISNTLCLATRPDGPLRTEDLTIVEVELPPLARGDVLVRNRWLSIDPSIRIRLNAETPDGYLPPFPVGEPLSGLAIGTVIESADPEHPVGQLVSHMHGYREHAVVAAEGSTLGGYGGLTAIDPGELPEQWFLGPLGSSGLTAYAGIVGVLGVSPDDIVWVSAAAGAVGSLAAQLAKARGARVIGSAGSPTKVRYLSVELGLDSAFDYHCESITRAVAHAAPDGITAYFDNVGGDHLAAALGNMRPGGRIAMCGAISGYDLTAPAPGPANLFQFVAKGLRMDGFRAGSFNHLMPDMQREIGGYLRSGRIRFDERVFHGLDAAPAAMVAMLNGENTGKTLVRLDTPETSIDTDERP